MSIRALGIGLCVLSLVACEFVATDEANRDGSCGEHSSCPHDQACGSGQCVDLAGRRYAVSAVDLELCNTNLDGEPFDSLNNSAPDPKIELRYQGQTLYQSSAHEDALATTFTLTGVEVDLTDFEDSFVVEVHDQDLALSELMDTVAVDVGYPGLRAGELLRSHRSDCTESPVTRVVVRLSPVDGAW